MERGFRNVEGLDVPVLSRSKLAQPKMAEWETPVYIREVTVIDADCLHRPQHSSRDEASITC